MKDEDVVVVGGENVYADLGYADASTFKVKAQLARTMSATIKERGLTQAAAAKRMGVSQPEVSRLVRGHFRDFTTDRLMVMLTRLEVDIDITMRDHGREIGGVHLRAADLVPA